MSESKIQKVEAIQFNIPFSKSLKYGSKGHRKEANHVLVRITTDEGVTGIGEAAPYADLYGESQVSIAWAVEHWIAPKLEGFPLFAIEKVWDEMEAIGGNFTAKGAVDIAIHDAQAKSLGIPLYKLLGGWADKIPLTWIVGQAETDEMIDESLEAQKKGYKSFKVKVGIDSKKDVEVIRLLRQKLGDGALIYIDANTAYSYNEASRVLPIMVNYGIGMVEDPISICDIQGRLRLSKQIPVPIIGDYCTRSPIEAKREIDLGAISIINIKTPRTGYFQSRKVVHLAEQAGLPCIIGTMVETDIGVLASAHFGAAFKIFSYPAELTYFLKMEDHLLKDPIKIENGKLLLSDKPGLGAELDEGKIEYYHKRN